MMINRLPADTEAVDLVVNQPCLAIALSGRGKRQYTSGHRVRDLYSSPAMFELYSDQDTIDRARWQGVGGEVLSIHFPPAHVNRLLHAEGSGFQLPTVHELFGARLTDLALSLWHEAQEGGRRSRLYADGLSLALLGLLMEHHGACRGADRRSPARLSSAESRRVRDHIEDHLATDLSVEALAALVHMSPAHFSRAFRESLGAPPHAYVTERRIDHATRLLRGDRGSSIAEIADSLGFSSQSHFTDAFRRKVGVTPGRWRAGLTPG